MRRARPRKLPSLDIDPQAPPEIRQRNATVLRTTWHDPDDMRPNARSPGPVAAYFAQTAGCAGKDEYVQSYRHKAAA